MNTRDAGTGILQDETKYWVFHAFMQSLYAKLAGRLPGFSKIPNHTEDLKLAQKKKIIGALEKWDTRYYPLHKPPFYLIISILQ